MTMPKNLVLVRHGQSEGNIANKRSRKGDHSDFTLEFRSRHSSTWRLTDLGIEQAKTAGLWIRENLTSHFRRYYVSEYLRAMETAHHLELPEAVWYADYNLREREWGNLDVIPESERQERFAQELVWWETDSFYWRPPNGESFADLCSKRLVRNLDTLHRECSEMDWVIIVCHGEVMWAYRVLLERMSQRHFKKLQGSKHPHNNIHNCQIIHYTRLNPETREEGLYLDWVRSICPTDLSLSSNEWEPIVRPRYSNEDLLAEVNLTPRLVN